LQHEKVTAEAARQLLSHLYEKLLLETERRQRAEHHLSQAVAAAELSRTELSDLSEALSAQEVSLQGKSSLLLHHMVIRCETSVHAMMWLLSLDCLAAHTPQPRNPVKKLLSNKDIKALVTVKCMCSSASCDSD